MMPKTSLEPGDLVIVLRGECSGMVGIVTQPITEDDPGHVLLHRQGCILGMQLSYADVAPADRDHEGFAQLAYNLIQLGSRVIEARLIV
ncbi:MAG TPA: hypothetical protein VK880_10360 [Anaerolineales bacterium]|nr:hypothetical protein [Anaerolineales bacterium]